MLKPVLLAACLLVAWPTTAQIYEWRDARGMLNYSDRPPPGVAAKLVRPGNSAAAADDASGDGSGEPQTPAWMERDRELRERRAQTAEARARADEERRLAAVREADCKQARGQLMALESGQRISRFNERGEREILDDTARTAELARTRAWLDANCSGS
jgi:hypothetical protein